jgi:Domain of unknown function (DUF4365)
MLPRNLRQEALSRAYVRAIAARAGVVCIDATQDFGIDCYLRAVTLQAGHYSDIGPELDVQLKSTTRAKMRDTEVVYDLEVRSYNILREPSAAEPQPHDYTNESMSAEISALATTSVSSKR